jgi:hypothetical protein
VRVARAAGRQRLAQTRPVAAGAGQAVIHIDPRRLDTQSLQSVPLRGQILFLGGHPRVPDQQSKHDAPRGVGRPGNQRRGIDDGHSRYRPMDIGRDGLTISSR